MNVLLSTILGGATLMSMLLGAYGYAYNKGWNNSVKSMENRAIEIGIEITNQDSVFSKWLSDRDGK